MHAKIPHDKLLNGCNELIIKRIECFKENMGDSYLLMVTVQNGQKKEDLFKKSLKKAVRCFLQNAT